jgi:hypothetical protein
MRSAAAAPPGGGAPLEGKHINVQPTIKNQVLTWSRDLTGSVSGTVNKKYRFFLDGTSGFRKYEP